MTKTENGEVLETWPEHLDFSVHVEREDRVPSEPALYQGTLNALFTSGAFATYFDLIRMKTSKAFGASDMRLYGKEVQIAFETARDDCRSRAPLFQTAELLFRFLANQSRELMRRQREDLVNRQVS